MKYVIKKYKEGYILKAISWFGLKVRYVRTDSFDKGELCTKEKVAERGINYFISKTREEAEETKMILEGKL